MILFIQKKSLNIALWQLCVICYSLLLYTADPLHLLHSSDLIENISKSNLLLPSGRYKIIIFFLYVIYLQFPNVGALLCIWKVLQAKDKTRTVIHELSESNVNISNRGSQSMLELPLKRLVLFLRCNGWRKTFQWNTRNAEYLADGPAKDLTFWQQE